VKLFNMARTRLGCQLQIMRKLLIASLLLNVCLVVLAAYQFWALSQRKVLSENVTGGIVATRAGLESGMPKTRGDWMAIESKDWKLYVRNLRATGCPEETVRDIVFSEVNRTYAARWRSTNGDSGKKYWESRREGWWGHTKQKQFNALEREKKKLLQDLLGIDADAQLHQYFILNYDAGVETRQLDFLPTNRQEKLNKMLDKDDKEIQAVWLKQEPGGGLPQAAQHELNVALEKRNDDLAKMLSSAELEEYELRNATLAKDLRRQLYGFDATEKEFRKIFEVEKNLHDRFADVPFNSTDDKTSQKRAVATEQAEKEIREALGEKRYGEYLRAKDVQYQKLLNFTDELEVSKSIADQSYEVIARATESLKRLSANTNMNVEQRQARAAAIEAETDAALRQAMGENGLKFYKQNYGGWLANAGK
jgi:hypothetical protein